jgi:MFS family permease
VGAVLGPNLVGPAAAVADGLALEPLAGPYLVASVALLAAAAVVVVGLRTDLPPPKQADETVAAEATSRPTLRAGLRSVRASPAARTGLVTAALAHTVMVSVMVMTPVHMHDGGASISVIGLVISGHVAGMYALSPVMGWAADRWDRRPVAAAGAVTLAVAAGLAAVSAPGPSAALAGGLVLLGLGWSACLVASSALVADGVTGADRTAAQGATDTVMSLSAALGGAVAGVVVGTLGFAVLGWGAAVVAGLLLVALRPRHRGPRRVEADRLAAAG